jgi:acetate kinase
VPRVRVLVVNAGSSSLKHALVEDGSVVDSGTERWDPQDRGGRHGEALSAALADAGHEVDAVGHRVVHGGPSLRAAALLDDDVREAIAEAASLAPLHNRAALEGIVAAGRAFPDVPQVACFDTAFHWSLPEAAATYPIPREWSERFAIRRYGFHGLNVEWCAGRARELLGADAVRRLVVCHLGSGSSVTAVLDGRSAGTSMGYTPLEGVPMATRSGSIDPGIPLRLARAGMSADDLDDALNHRSGLLALAGTADLREVPVDSLAFEVLARGVAAAVGAMATALGGLDCLVFTAGMGEGSAPLRAAVCSRVEHLGVTLDDELNESASPDAEVGRGVLVLKAREELVVARQTEAVVRGP